MIRKERLLGVLFLTFITAHYMLYIAHCQVTIRPCEVRNTSSNTKACVYGVNKTVKDGYDVLWAPPNCSRWVCNVSQEAFFVYGCAGASDHRYMALPMPLGACYWPKCCNETLHPECFKG
uniref:Putative 8.9 kDa family member n=1 Tax=Rhipicephalus pulchellus TaxID=72859 RepID=L7MC63_RHIPC